jgi:hypothetical protein
MALWALPKRILIMHCNKAAPVESLTGPDFPRERSGLAVFEAHFSGKERVLLLFNSLIARIFAHRFFLPTD